MKSLVEPALDIRRRVFRMSELIPISYPVDRHGNVLDQALSGEAVSLVIKQRTADAGIDPDDYSGQSLQADLATSVAAEVSSWKIRQQTGHARAQCLPSNRCTFPHMGGSVPSHEAERFFLPARGQCGCPRTFPMCCPEPALAGNS